MYLTYNLCSYHLHCFSQKLYVLFTETFRTATNQLKLDSHLYSTYGAWLVNPVCAGGGEDFSTDALDITFPADESEENIQLQLPAVIPIVDDNIDEAEREYFIVHLSQIDHALPGLVLGTTISIGGIEDNDGK